MPSELPSCRINAYRRSSSWIKLCLRIYAIYPLLQCQSSSCWAGKTIWPESRRPRFESWLDLLSLLSVLQIYSSHLRLLTQNVWTITGSSPTSYHRRKKNILCSPLGTQPRPMQEGNMKSRSWELQSVQTTQFCQWSVQYNMTRTGTCVAKISLAFTSKYLVYKITASQSAIT